MALRMAASSVGSFSSRYIATCESDTRRRIERARKYHTSTAKTPKATNRNVMMAEGLNRSVERPRRHAVAKTEAQRLQARGGEEEREQRARDHHHRAAHGEALAPAVSHRPNDLEQFAATVHGGLQERGWRLA